MINDLRMRHDLVCRLHETLSGQATVQGQLGMLLGLV